MVINILHLQLWNSITRLLETFEIHYENIPSEEALMSTEIDTLLEQPRTQDPRLPFWNINVMINRETLLLDPKEEIIVKILTQLYDLWIDLLTKFETYLPDPFYEPFLW